MKIVAFTLACALIVQTAFALDQTELKEHNKQMATYPADSITLDALLGMDKQKFKGKTVAEFLASQEAKGYTKVQHRTDNEQGREGVRIKYSSNLYLHIRLVPDASLQQLAINEVWKQKQVGEAIIEEIGVIYVMHEGGNAP